MLVLTVIGLRFLTQIINKYILPNELSIHFFVNGFSFCTNTQIDFTPINDGIEDLKVSLKKKIEFFQKDDFEIFSVVFFQRPSTFVPQKFFDSKKSKIYLSLYNKTPKEDIVAYDILESQQQVNVYSFEKEIKIILDETEIQFNFIHYNTILQKKILSICSFIEFKYQLFIHIQYKAVDVFLAKTDQIVFNNRFSIKNEDEFLYYIFFVVEQFDLKFDDFEIIFLGKFFEYNKYYDLISQFHKNYKFIENDSDIIKDQSKHSAPYLANYSG